MVVVDVGEVVGNGMCVLINESIGVVWVKNGTAAGSFDDLAVASITNGMANHFAVNDQSFGWFG